MIRATLTLVTLALVSFHSPVTVPATASAARHEVLHRADAVKTGPVTFAQKRMAFDDHALEVYNEANLRKAGLSFGVFQKAFTGFVNFKQQGLIASSKSVLTVIDFTKPSHEKRMWIVDVKAKSLLYNTLVAHGRNTGEGKAVKFSNVPESFMSSIGFFLTDKTYFGKHGLSLRLSGVDGKYNSNAMERAIVIHGADYVSEAFVRNNGRLGRSLGCPAVPQELSKEVINTIKDKTCLYINGTDRNYTSKFLNATSAVEAFALRNPNRIQQI